MADSESSSAQPLYPTKQAECSDLSNIIAEAASNALRLAMKVHDSKNKAEDAVRLHAFGSCGCLPKALASRDTTFNLAAWHSEAVPS